MQIRQTGRYSTFISQYENLVKTIDTLPEQNEVIKIISKDGGFASIHFIQFVANLEGIAELTAATLRVGKKQAECMLAMHKTGKLDKASFFTDRIMTADTKKGYDYAKDFNALCRSTGWQIHVVKNHSKVMLMKSKRDKYYVLETSSNLNDNPMIEQYSFTQDKALYDFYYNFYEGVT